MKTKLITLLLGIFVLSSSVHAQNGLAMGSALPKATIKMKDVSGKLVCLNDAKESNGILVMFSCNTCPYVIKNQQRTKEICEYAKSKNIGVIILNANEGNRTSDDSFASMKEYAKEQNYKWFYAVDSNNDLADAFGANRTPECFLFDKSGKLVYHGAIDDSPSDETKVTRHHLQEAMNETLAGKPVTVKETRSVGCVIKRKN
jgi:thioredoxin-related protein